MLADYFSNIERVGIYAFISFLIFFLFFVLVTIHTVRLGRDEVEKMSRIPLDDGSEISDETISNS